MQGSSRATRQTRPMLLSRRWLQVAVLVFVVGFFGLGVAGYLSYTQEAPMPARTLDEGGAVVFTRTDIVEGQKVFLKNGLMQYGSVFGHGAYLGPDFTADYLHRELQLMQTSYGERFPDDTAGRAAVTAAVTEDLKTNRYDAASDTLDFTAAQAAAFDELVAYYQGFFSEPTTRFGLRREAITDPVEVRQLTAFFAWTAWASTAERPGQDYSYTNNWPAEPSIGNTATGDALVWSALSIIALLAGTGLLLGAFGRFDWLGWHGRDQLELRFRDPDDVALTPAQRATAWFFLVMAVLFVLQTLVGALTQHYRADLATFFGLDVAALLPYNMSRTWHLQLTIFWVATSFLAAGIFLLPMITGREPRRQNVLSYLLLGALALVVFGSLLGEYAGQRGRLGSLWSYFGNQGLEYIDLGRFWQALLVVGLLFWVVILFRGMRGKLRNESVGNMPWLFLFAALAIPAFYAVSLLARPGGHTTINEFWRFWMVHLWVEDFLELFTTVLVAYIFVLLGVVRERIAMTVIYLDIILYSVGGVIGTLHHVYFSGTPAAVMAMGAFFSAAEVIPLTLLTLEAWSFMRLGAQRDVSMRTRFPHYWAVMFLVAVGFWNFLGAGVFGFLINLPIVSYYEIGTGLTANHAHTAMMGVYGMLAAGIAVFCLRYLIPQRRWSDRLAGLSFWSLNIGLAWMAFASLFPLGVLQLHRSVTVGYWDARTLAYLGETANVVLEWVRLPGDILFIVGGALPLLWLAVRGVLGGKRHVAELDEHSVALFTEVTFAAADEDVSAPAGV
ncbi:MAG: nitric-oxide reductase large subunit [Actinomycetota bacterium]|nr:MAG: nitric-oxide reductase large subunit [Actinomycetota bacterium]